MSNFLKNLQESLENTDNPDFNSESAKKIKEIAEKVSNFTNEELEAIKIKADMASIDEKTKVSKEEAIELNSVYEKKMEQIKKQDIANTQLATLIDIEDMVNESVVDMLGFIKELEEKFETEFIKEVSIFGDLYIKMEQIKSKYNQ